MWFTIVYIVSALVYLAFDRISAMCITLAVVAQTATYMVFALKNLKPNVYVLIFFEVCFILSSILTWQDAWDILPLIAIVSSVYGEWQNRQFILRSVLILEGICYLTYCAVITAYISLGIEIVNLMCAIFAFVYYCILKKEKPIFEWLFKIKQEDTFEMLESPDKEKDNEQVINKENMQ